MSTLIERFHSKVKKIGECWEWQNAKVPFGYGVFRYFGRQGYAHRFSYQHYVGEIPLGLHVLHRCDNPPCVNPNHLFLGDDADNHRDMVLKGRQTSGEKDAMHKLAAKQVAKIRELRKSGLPLKELSKIFNVCEATISMISNRVTWKHLL